MRTFFVAALMTLTSCASVGTNFDTGAVNQLTVGMSKQEVISRLGKPNYVVSMADGSTRLTWSHSSGSMFGSKAKAVALPFDAQDRLTSVPKM